MDWDITSATTVTNQTQWQTAEVTTDWNIVEGTLLVVVTVVGIFVNLFIVAAILSSRRLRRRITDVLCCHLALVGIVWSAVLLPVNVTAAFSGGWPLRSDGSDRAFCDVHGYMQATLVHVMVWTIAVLGWKKYQTIIAPLRRVCTVSRQRMAAVLLPTWAIGLTLACIPLISGSGVGSYSYGHVVVACVYKPSLTTEDDAPTVASIVFSVATTFFGFLLPVCVTAHSYLRIYNIARWHQKRIAVMSAVVHVITLSVGVPMARGQGLPEVSGNGSPPAEDPTADQTTVQYRHRKASRNVLTFVVALVLCYAPHYTLVAIAPAIRRPTHPPYSSVSSSSQFPVPVEVLSGIVVLASPAVNGFIYGVRNRAMIRSFRSFIRPPALGERLTHNMVSNV